MSVVYDEARAAYFTETPAPGGGVIRVAIDGDRLRDTSRIAPAQHHVSQSGYRVTVERSCCRSIDEQLIGDGLESGSWLLGSSVAGYARLVLAAGCGSSPERFSDALRVDIEVAEELDATSTDGLIVCGHWHTHFRNETKPSDPDRACWEAWRQRLGRDVFVGLIISGAEDFSAPPRWDAFVATKGRCEPATLSVQKNW
jgi:hypothetical protein